MLLKSNPDHPLAQNYLKSIEDQKNKMLEQLAKNPKKEEIPLPELKAIDFDSFYDLFKEWYQYVNKKPFDETQNEFEAKDFIKTMLYYFLGSRKFLKSPLLNKKSEPQLYKGLLIIGGMGVGKTSVIKTFFQMFFESQTRAIYVKDIEGTSQLLGRYKKKFMFYSANEVWNDYKKISMHARKSDEEYAWDLFWKKHTFGKNYYDDLGTEETMKNYGETLEIFKKILEERYEKKTLTMLSMNYVSEDLTETLNDFAKKYGERLYDRVWEMFNIIELKGETLRK